jgi:hypothetical protein
VQPFDFLGQFRIWFYDFFSINQRQVEQVYMVIELAQITEQHISPFIATDGSLQKGYC